MAGVARFTQSTGRLIGGSRERCLTHILEDSSKPGQSFQLEHKSVSSPTVLNDSSKTSYLQQNAIFQIRLYSNSARRPNFFSQFLENIKQEMQKNKEMKESLKKFREEADKLEQSEALKSARQKFQTVESEASKSSEVLKEKIDTFKEKVSRELYFIFSFFLPILQRQEKIIIIMFEGTRSSGRSEQNGIRKEGGSAGRGDIEIGKGSSRHDFGEESSARKDWSFSNDIADGRSCASGIRSTWYTGQSLRSSEKTSEEKRNCGLR